jgi:hypothetical protein
MTATTTQTPPAALKFRIVWGESGRVAHQCATLTEALGRCEVLQQLVKNRLRVQVNCGGDLWVDATE